MASVCTMLRTYVTSQSGLVCIGTALMIGGLITCLTKTKFLFGMGAAATLGGIFIIIRACGVGSKNKLDSVDACESLKYADVMKSPSVCVASSKLYKDITTKQWPIVYSPMYNIHFFGLEKLHPFDSGKWGRILAILQDSKMLLTDDTIVEPLQATTDDLLVVHSPRFLGTLKSSSTIARITEIPPVAWLPNSLLDWLVLARFRYQTGGTILAAKLALDRGWAINIGGGFHHSFKEMGGGFCVYADISLALKFLFLNKLIKKAMIVDLDAHQGNGHARDFMGDNKVYIMDVYNADIYPRDSYAKDGITRKVEVHSGIKDTEYLDLVKSNLKAALKEFEPDIVIYNAGTDILEGDPLGRMAITAEGIKQRDQFVFEMFRKRSRGRPAIPIVFVTSGGYQKITAQNVAESIINLYEEDLISAPKG